MVSFFVNRYGKDLGYFGANMPTPDAMDALHMQLWPGNVRELKNVIRKALLTARGYPITQETIHKVLGQTIGQTIGWRPDEDLSLAHYIRELLSQAKRGELQDVHRVLTKVVERELTVKLLH